MRQIVFIMWVLAAGVARAADQPQWGQQSSRNMISAEKALPDSFDPATKKHVKWVAQLGSESYATPIVAHGRVLIGTNNNAPRDPKHKGDRGVLLCLDETDGHLLWQLVVPKLEDDKYLDWPGSGICSPPTVDGDRIYAVTNRAEVVCLTQGGLAAGNVGPFTDEARHMTPRGEALLAPGPTDADIVWLFDLVSHAGIHPHDQTHISILLDGDILYLNTSNGVDNTHRKIRSPDAPSLIALDKRTGKLLAKDDQHIGPLIFHNTWSSPSMGIVNGRKTLFFCGGDGVCYAFEPLSGPPIGTDEVATLKCLWRFDCDPAGPKENVHRFTGNHNQGPSTCMCMPVFVDNRIYLTSGGDLFWGKREGYVRCIDATAGSGDITRSGEVWKYPIGSSFSTAAVYDRMVFVTSCEGGIYCVDAITGQPLWTHKVEGQIWASPLVADGKVYIGTRNGEFLILAANREKRLISTAHFEDPIAGTATAANGVLYVATMKRIYAIQ
jgi:outer membrane protein assembly factor BamB